MLPDIKTKQEEKSELKFRKRRIDKNCDFSRNLVHPRFSGISAIYRQDLQQGQASNQSGVEYIKNLIKELSLLPCKRGKNIDDTEPEEFYEEFLNCKLSPSVMDRGKIWNEQ